MNNRQYNKTPQTPVYSVKDVKQHTSLSGPLIYRLHKESDFPAPIYLPQQRYGWRIKDIHAWMQNCVNARNAYAPHAPKATVLTDDAFIAFKDLCERLALSRQTINRLEAAKAFPVRVRLGRRRVAWLKSEIDTWIAASPQPDEDGPAIPLSKPEPNSTVTLPVNPYMNL